MHDFAATQSLHRRSATQGIHLGSTLIIILQRRQQTTCRLVESFLVCTNLHACSCTHTEYDAKCVLSHQANLTRLGIQVVTGDQSDIPTLHKWINQTGGNFDVIIDDGGHANHQIYNSFHLLFFKALKPGGAYFIEDLQVTRWPAWRGTGDELYMN